MRTTATAARIAAALLAAAVTGCGGGSSSSSPASSTPSPAASSPASTASTGAGNAAAGKTVFTQTADPSCASCHTLADANANGSIGPDLDQLKPSYDAVVAQVTSGGGQMPPYGGSLSKQQIEDVATYVSSVAGS